MPRPDDEGTGGMVPEGYDVFAIPEGMKQKDEMKLQWQFLGSLSAKQREIAAKVEESKKEADTYKDELSKQSSKKC